MFDAAHAALFALGVEGLTSPIKTHNGLTAKFGQHFIATGLIVVQHGHDLNKVQTLRQLADYSGDPVAHEDAAWAVERAGAFVAAIRSAIETREL
jgi:uncharacterized protein (UPF0332 family)